jgi:microcystin-dependent protein
MADQFIGEIRTVGFNFAPQGWALCNGQLLPISQYTALFSLLGTFYGGDGRSNFALPNLQGNAPMDQGNGQGLTPRTIGESGGSTSVTLLTTQIPSHNHVAMNAAASNAEAPATNVVFGGGGRGKPEAFGQPSASVAAMSAQAVAITGNSQPHNNMPPYLTLNFIIALQGIFPSRG